MVAREVVGAGTPGLRAIIDRFGEEFLTSKGDLDRPRLARLVFSDSAALSDLNAIVHPLVRERIGTEMAAHVNTDQIVVLSVPLFVESGQYQSDCLIVVDVEPEIAIKRVMAQRGWDRDDVESRLSAQATPAERLRSADYVIDNNGSLRELEARVEDAWQWIVIHSRPGSAAEPR